MRYFENSTLTFHIEPQEFDRHSPREILQYAVGGLLYMPATRTKIADEIIERVINPFALIWRMRSVMIPLSRQNVV